VDTLLRKRRTIRQVELARSRANPGYLERPGRGQHRRTDARWSLQGVRSALWRFDGALVLSAYQKSCAIAHTARLGLII